MDANQTDFENPFAMDADCENCAELCGARDRVVHGYGDVGAEFLVVGTGPTEAAERNGVPFTGASGGERVQSIFADLGFVRSAPDAAEPDVQNLFFTNLTRCRHPDREPTDREVDTCEPFLNAEIRMINPQIIVPVGDRPLRELAVEYTTRRPDSFDVDAEHATTIRGRGFELVPMKEPSEMSDAEADAFCDHMRENVLSRDYRQTKGRQSR
ncbi:uracil-DNA glycosylase family protein [Halorubrum ezzemoulense]|uniref:uracil-DNA glycosylase n=1 Tax=Halorubrum ezzemoulense TaxID=337243 RepID=UPI00232B0CA6|nr:uracil-DNA glycosylase family protein [Halorubrum ezzemoulense]MDB2274749.1 uracil-DNA glycosylase family protein [Halorubrum ezzemoulense]